MRRILTLTWKAVAFVLASLWLIFGIAFAMIGNPWIILALIMLYTILLIVSHKLINF